MPAIIVRPAQHLDLPRLAQLWYEKAAVQQQSDARLRLSADAGARWIAAASGWLADTQMAVLVAQDGDELAGYLVIRLEPGLPGWLPDQIGAVVDVAIDAHQHRAGAGRALVSSARAWLRSRGVEQIRVPVLRRAAVEQAFWRALGAQEWMDELWMKL